MSTFDALESSPNKGAPIQLYFFQYGAGEDAYYAYTDAEQAVIADIGMENPVTFQPVPVDRGEINSSGTLDKSSLEIRTPNDVELADLFRFIPPSQVVQLTIFEGHAGASQFLAIWVGRVLSASSQTNEKVYSCEPIATSLKRVGLRRNWQWGCPLLLYGPDCRADIERATEDSTVQGISGPIIALPAGWVSEAERTHFEGGFASWQTDDGRVERRSILRTVDESTILLSAMTYGLANGQLIQLTKGCPHDEVSCAGIHDNILNYGGQSKIPTTNPTGVKNNYY